MATLRSKVGHLTGLEQVHLLAIAANSPLGAIEGIYVPLGRKHDTSLL